MIIIGVDYYPSDQYIPFVDTETGECGERNTAAAIRGASMAIIGQIIAAILCFLELKIEVKGLVSYRVHNSERPVYS
jgi:hypothetical protein